MADARIALADRNEARLAEVHPMLRRRAHGTIGALIVLGIQVIVTEGNRPYERQQELYRMGRSTVSTAGCACPDPSNGKPYRITLCPRHPLGLTVTNAPPGLSWHQFGLAIDAVPDDLTQAGIQPDWNVQHPAWKTLLTVAKAFDLAEGAEWRSYPDNPHFYPKELAATPPAIVREIYSHDGLEGVWRWADSQWKGQFTTA